MTQRHDPLAVARILLENHPASAGYVPVPADLLQAVVDLAARATPAAPALGPTALYSVDDLCKRYARNGRPRSASTVRAWFNTGCFGPREDRLINGQYYARPTDVEAFEAGRGSQQAQSHETPRNTTKHHAAPISLASLKDELSSRRKAS